MCVHACVCVILHEFYKKFEVGIAIIIPFLQKKETESQRDYNMLACKTLHGTCFIDVCSLCQLISQNMYRPLIYFLTL